MMRPSQVLSLIAVAIAVAGAGLWVSRRGVDTTTEPQGQVLPLPQSDLNGVTGLRIFKGDGSHTTLTRNPAHWLVAERGYPADTGQVRKLLLDLSALQIEEQKTSDPTLYSKLGVEDPSNAQATSTGLAINIKGKTLGLIVGRASGTSSVYVRVKGVARSLLATPQLAPDADPRHWLDRSLLDIASDQVTEVDLKPQSGPDYIIKRSAPPPASGSAPIATPAYVVSPIPKGRELADASSPASQAGALAGLQLDDVRKAGGHTAVAHASFVTRNGLTLAISGIEDADQRYITVVVAAPASSAQSAAPSTAQTQARDLNARLAGWEFEIPSYRYDTLFRPLEQLLKPKAVAPKAVAPKAPAHLPFSPKSGTAGAGQDKVTPEQSH
ncbi:MAG TPA: DUF4340 domain-containing protein [Steroidobacteraceae bacterium]|jgi:hypothetical protein